MSEEILINVTPQETRVAIVENGVLQEVYVERSRRRGLVGNIYNGRVSRVLPGMQAAFIDIGLSRTAFLHVSDLDSGVEEMDTGEKTAAPSTVAIESLLREGQEILVQVLKDPIGTKGARLTTRVSIPSRYLVFVPGQATLGVSQRIEDEAERERLRGIMQSCNPAEMKLAAGAGNVVALAPLPGSTPATRGGFIVRTVAEGATAEDLFQEVEFLQRLWDSIYQRSKASPALTLVYEDLPLVMRTMRDLVRTQVEKVRIDSRETFQKVTEFARQFIPEFVARIEYYPGERPILDLYGVEDEIQKALNRKVQLKSGGHLVLDQTEAMTTIDVNTGAFVGHRNLEETIFKTNLEAAQAIARQLRLRNLGGIIIVDFIDMQEAEHARQVLRALEKHVERDHAKVAVSELTSLGLVQLTRKRTRESLEHTLCEPCPTCSGRGTVKTKETICYEIFREILREVRQFDTGKPLVVASQSIVDMMLEDESSSVAELEEFIRRPIRIQVEPTYHQEQYDIVFL